MTERERLVELLDIIIQPGQKTLGDIADYLLENGVIITPCEEAEKPLHKINHNSLCETETYKVDA